MTYCNLPIGTQDLLPKECQLLNGIKDRLSRKFRVSGFVPVMSAALEYYDTYSKISNSVAQERMFKLTDSDGKLLVLRPDMTLAISRIAATKLEELPIRLCYFADKYDFKNSGGITSREIYQAGVECLGEEGVFSDAQAIAFCIECMKETGLSDFIVDVGHVGYFKGVLEGCGLTDREAEEVRSLINAKDGLNAERILRKAGASQDTLNTVLQLPTLFGGAEVLDRAQTLTQNQGARKAIDHLKRVYDILARMGYEKQICFDLGTVRRLSYYSGIVFTGLVRQLGVPVLSGGRYDSLADDFGKHIPAVGFAIGLKRVLIALERQGNLPKETQTEATIACEEGAEEVAYEAFLRMTAEGKQVLLSPQYGKEGANYGAPKERYFATKKGVTRL